ncbi:MAG: SLC13 family permease [Acidobacteriota bacterium]
MTFEITFMLVLMVAALVAFIKEIFPIEVTALGMLTILVVAGFVSAEDAVAGFSSKAVVAIGGLFVLSHALMKTGVLEAAADRLSERSSDRPWFGIGVLLCTTGVLSGFLNNTAMVALAIPLVMKLCGRLDLSPSKVLIPLSYVSIFGGTLTLIGTSTNLLVSAVVEESGGEPFSMFEFTPMGLVFLVVGLLYVLLFANRLLPARAEVGETTAKYQMSGYLTELILEDKSKLVGSTLAEAGINERYQVTVLEIIRRPGADEGEEVEPERFVETVGRVRLRVGDVLIVQGTVEDILRLRKELGVSLLPDVKLDDKELAMGGQVMAEAWITHNSRMIGNTLKDLDFHREFGGFVLAIRRVGATLRKKVAHVRLRYTDSLLLLIPENRLDKLRRSDDLLVLSESEAPFTRGKLWWLVFLVLPAVIALAATGTLKISAGVLVGSVLLLLLGVMKPQDAYRSIDWSVIFLIAAFVPVGQAFVTTGTADFVASGILSATSWASPELAPYVALSMVYLATSVLTQMVSNNAAAIIVAPIALAIGPSLGVDARPFVLAVCFAASAEFMTPMGYQTNLMVYGAGGYRFLDYTRFGAPLNILFWLLGTLLIPVIWPFQAG